MNAGRFQAGGSILIIPCATGNSQDQVLEEVRVVAEQSGVADYLVLFSTREFKRVPNVRMRESGGEMT